MSVEERVQLALEDLEGLLTDGAGLADAIAETAGAVALKPEVLLARAERAWGDLQEVRLRLMRKASLSAAVRRYEQEGLLFSYPPVDFGGWFRVTFDEDLSQADLVHCSHELNEQRLEGQKRFHAQMLMEVARLGDKK